ncbi:MAG: universal stress protein [Planctomycetota bacterium]
MFKTILVALESSDLDSALLAQVTRLAWREDVRLALLHVVDPEGGDEYAEGEDVSIRLRHQAAQRHMEVLERRLSDSGLTVESHVVLGDPAERINSKAKELEADLIALATHGRSGPSLWWSGSVTEEVLRWAQVPVLVTSAAQETHAASEGFKHVLVPLDGSERAARILPQVRGFALLYGARVTLLRVGVQPAVPPLEIPLSTVELPSLREALLGEARAHVPDLAGVKAEAQVVFADTAADGILDLVEAGGIDLVALGSHGRTGLDRLLFGSTAEAVARSCKVPILVWRDPFLGEGEGASEE